MSEQQITIGQIWRRKKDGKLIAITKQSLTYDGSLIDDWYWSGHDYKGRGVSYGSYIRRDYELVEEQTS